MNPQQYPNVSETNFGNDTCGDTVVVSGPDLKAVKTDNVSGATTLPNGCRSLASANFSTTGPGET